MFTNHHGLPQVLANAVIGAEREPVNDPRIISVTNLIKPPQIRRLSYVHRGDVIEDVQSRVKALWGTAVHHIIERGAPKEAITEKRVHLYREIWCAECNAYAAWSLSGTPDYYAKGVLTDWKTTAMNKNVREVKPEWEQQLNVYAYMLGHVGCAGCEPMPVTSLTVVQIFRDWKEWSPEPTSIELPVVLWNSEFTDTFIDRRLALHERAIHGDIEACTDEDRWDGRRCQSWCEAAVWCPQWLDIQQNAPVRAPRTTRGKSKDSGNEKDGGEIFVPEIPKADADATGEGSNEPIPIRRRRGRKTD